MHTFKLSVLAIAMGLAPALAHADTNSDILNELQSLKAKVQQLEAQVKAQQAQISDNEKATADAAKVANHADIQVAGVKDATESSGFKGLKVSGMIAPSYVYNQDQQSSSFVMLNNGGAGGSSYQYDNSYFGGAYIDFQKTTDSGVLWHLTLAPDRGAGAVFNNGSIVHEASVKIPLNSNTDLIAGQIPDWEGYEYTWDNQNIAVTHNLLFDFAELTAYTGVGLHQTLDSGNFEWKAMVANVDSARYYYDNNYGGRAPALIVRGDYYIPGYDNAGIGGWLMLGKLPNYGAGAPATGTSSAQMAEIDGYLTSGDWNYYGQVSVGQQTAAAYNGGKAQWWGASGMITYNFTPRLLGFARVDYLDTSKNGGSLLEGNASVDGINGFGPDPATCSTDANGNLVDCTGPGAKRYALSLGGNYRLTQSTTLKLEYRYDRANLATFQNASDGMYKKSNSLLAGSVVVSF